MDCIACFSKFGWTYLLCAAGVTIYLLLTVCSWCDHVFIVDCVQLVWPCIYCWLCAVGVTMYLLLTVCSWCDHVFIVDCVQLVWPCVCCWLCAVHVTMCLLLTVCSWCDHYLLLTVCSWCDCEHVFVVDCVQLVWLWACVCCWLCAVGVTVSMCLLLTVCSWCDCEHVFVVDCVHLVWLWACVCCWLCAVDVSMSWPQERGWSYRRTARLRMGSWMCLPRMFSGTMCWWVYIYWKQNSFTVSGKRLFDVSIFFQCKTSSLYLPWTVHGCMHETQWLGMGFCCSAFCWYLYLRFHCPWSLVPWVSPMMGS